MRVNIDGIWYDAEQQPIQIELTDSDKNNISNMASHAKNYISFPDHMSWEEVKESLKIN